MRTLLAALCAIVLGIGAPRSSWAHSDLQQAEPAAGSSVPSPPAALRLRFSEPLDLAGTRVAVTDERGQPVDAGELALGPPSDRMAIVGLAPLGEGVYTVRWWTLSQVDGHRWQGTYRFGVGRVPPAGLDVAAPLPSPAELAVRWLALVATALVVGGLAFRAWALEPALAARPCPGASRRAAAWQRGALWLLALASLGEFVATLGVLASEPPGPDARFGVGKPGALALLRLALVPMIGYLAGPSGSTGMALAFAGMLVLARGQVAHAALFGLGPILVATVHQLVAAIWIGGAAYAALVLPTLAASAPELLRQVTARFSALAVGAASLALLTGLASAGLLGLEPERLLDSRYGQALAVKLLLVLGMLASAALVWRRLRRSASPVVSRRSWLPVELALGAGVLGAASALALLPAPSDAGATALELVRPAGSSRVALHLDAVRVGSVRAEVRFADRSGAPLLVSDPVARLRAMPLDVDGPGVDVVVTLGDGRWTASLPIDRPGWWRVAAIATPAGETVEVPFELLVPDPNRAGPDPPAPEPAGERLFGAALDRLEALRAVRERQLLADGLGGLIVSTAEYVAPDRARLTTGDGDESVTVGAAQAFRRAGDATWRPLRRAAPLRYPIYRATYQGATAQRLGRAEVLDGVPTRVLSFYVPRDRAWYCWWVGDDSLVHQEAMIAPSHYMTSRLDRFDRPADITIEDAPASPGAHRQDTKTPGPS